MNYGYARCSTNETKQDINRQVRELKAEYPGIYPDVFRYTAYFVKWRDVLEGMVCSAAEKGCRVSQVECPDFNMVLLLLKLRFPEAYELCCS